MDFLPIEINNQKVYAGFWKRLGSTFIDILVFIPFMIIFHFVVSLSIPAAITITLISGLLYSCYTVYFHYKFGATLGKMALGIKVTLANGEKLGFKQAILRSSVDLVFAIFIAAAQIIAILNADPEIYLKSEWMERTKYTMTILPVWYGKIDISNQIWYWGEFVVLLLNKRKRALHDFIAGTIVINKEFAE